jgi:diadenosine tetraphosphate (Ap4A) HIT family hydrolase
MTGTRSATLAPMSVDLVRPSRRVRRRRVWSILVNLRRWRRSDAGCFVCEIVSGAALRLQHHVVYEDDDAIAFLDYRPPLWGATLVCPKEHREQVTGDFDEASYLRLQRVVHRVGEAVRRTVPCERLYVMSLGSQRGNRHVHWHLAPLPPGVPELFQQCRSYEELLVGRLDIPDDEMARLAISLREQLDPTRHSTSSV